MCKHVTTKEGVSSNDYALKSCLFVEVAILLTTGRTYRLSERGLEDQILGFRSKTAKVGRCGMSIQEKHVGDFS